jgi:tRNA(fMet)-specific endonuclease VapC
MFILDTNTLTDLLKEHHKIIARIREAPDDRRIVTSIVSRIEILRGRFASIFKAANRVELLNAAARLARDQSQLSELDVLDLSEMVADVFEKLRTDKKLKKIGREDLLIACFALAHRATLVTRNLKDFKLVPGLAVENWAD